MTDKHRIGEEQIKIIGLELFPEKVILIDHDVKTSILGVPVEWDNHELRDV